MNWNIKDIAWVGDGCVKGGIKSVVVSFHGLGAPELKKKAEPWEQELADLGALVIMPYYGPWSWMNREARAMVDELITRAYREYRLDAKEVPLVLTGGSMGGCSALLYARYTPHPLTAVYANCPVCDVTYHFRERDDLPRTMYCAFSSYEGEIEERLIEHSPLHQVDHLPDVNYMIVHGGADSAVNKARHSDRMVAAMQARAMRVEYIEVPGMGHCGPFPTDVTKRSYEFMRASCAGTA